MERLLGFVPAALCASGASLLSLVHPDDRQRIALLLPSLVNGQVTRALELRMQHADGARVLWFSQTSVPLRDESGATTGLQCMAQDITARRDLQEQMVREQRFGDLGRMAASIAHEIRNPLGAIVNSINVLKRPHNQEAPARGAPAPIRSCSTSSPRKRTDSTTSFASSCSSPGRRRGPRFPATSPS